MADGISAQIHGWREQLLDTSKRNRLIHFRIGRAGGVPLVHPDPSDLWQRLVIDGKHVSFVWQRELVDLPEEPVSPADTAAEILTPQVILERCRNAPGLREYHVLTDWPDGQLATRLNRLALNARESLSEQGLITLFVAFGFLRWFESNDSDHEVRSPLLLVPVRLDRDNIDAPWQLRAEDEDILPNHTLAQRLLHDHRLVLPLPGEDDLDPDDPTWRTRYFGEIQRQIQSLKNWDVLDEVALGIFSFQKLAMWDDLGRNEARIQGHDLCRAIAGDRTVTFSFPRELPQARELDEVTRPAGTFHILDADSSQHAAIEAAVRGASLVLDGPPGTGKSQTIANTIAAFLAAGKTVLFVSEKTAALEVVKRRLDDRGLGDFCLELHSHKANKRDIINEMGRCASLPAEQYQDRGELQRLLQMRGQLNGYVRELHQVREPLGRSAYAVHGQLVRLERLGSLSRCPVPDVLARDGEYLRRLMELLARLPDCRAPLEEGPDHPWFGCQARVDSLTLRDDVRHHLGQLAGVARRINETIPELHEVGFVPKEPTRGEWAKALEQMEQLLDCPVLPAAWFAVDARKAAGATLELDQLTRRCRERSGRLPEFDGDAIRLAGAFPGERPWAGLVQVDGETTRQRHARLTRLTTLVANLMRGLDQATQAWEQLIALTGAKFPPLPLARLGEVASLLERTAQMPPIPRSWKANARRRELRKVCDTCQQETEAAEALRFDLLDRLSPRVFGSEYAALAIEASGYSSFVSRLWPRWWSLKRQVAGWYTRQVPSTQVLFDDLTKLVRHHRHADHARQAAVQYRKDLIHDGADEVDWEATREALEGLERLEAVGKLQAKHLGLLASEDDPDRERLANTATALVESVRGLAETLESARRDIAVPSSQATLAELVEQVRIVRQRVEREAAWVTPVCGLLRPGEDVAIDRLEERGNLLAELGGLRLRVAQLRQEQNWPEEPAVLEARDGSAEATLARRLLGLLDSWGGPLAPHESKALHDPALRQRLTVLLSQGRSLHQEGRDDWSFLAGLFDRTQPISEGVILEQLPLVRLETWLRKRAGLTERLGEWTLYADIVEEIERADVRSILEEVRSGQVKVEEAASAFQARFLRLWLDALYAQVPALRGFVTEEHERRIEQFRDLDRLSIRAAPLRIREQQLGRPDRPRTSGDEPPGSSELGILLHEMYKKRRHLPLRRLFTRVPGLLLKLKPCLMMSPLAVSTFLESPDIHFDLVIFDEASQVRPHDAICAIYRGKQLMVCGDQKQLPPTAFFERGMEDDEEEAEEGTRVLRDFESILDVCCTLDLPRRRLRWHYRSRREALIAFANHHVYHDELVTFPSIEDTEDHPAIRFEYVEQGRWKAGVGGGFNVVEARRTAERVLGHFLDHPGQSLGVIAFSTRQQMRILDELEDLRRQNPEFEAFFDEERDDPFFVKNLENVQGDERDVLFLAIGYGPDEQGRVHLRFGPLNQENGERRLNVAVTRARQGMTVISSMRAHDIDLTRTSARGVHLLRAYLDYAENGPETLLRTITRDETAQADSPFEQEVHAELTSKGLSVHRQVGCSGYRIDLAIVHPQTPGRYLLGVECDGATYHSSATARDRDRLRQEVLESLGWRLCRVWSTDWVRNRAGQVKRVLEALEAAERAPARAEPSRNEPLALENRIKKVPNGGKRAKYTTIDDVPEEVLHETVLRVLREYGAMPREDLVRSVARGLGFQRAGKNIQARTEEAIGKLEQSGALSRLADDRLQAAPTRQVVG